MKESDEREFREFAATRMDHLRGLAYLTCGDWHAAEDAVSTALASLYLHWTGIRNRDAYARTTVVRASIDEKRRPWRRERPATDTLPDRPVADLTADHAERAYLLTALDRIPRGQRAVVVLRFYEELSVEEVARVLGRSTGTIKSQSARGLMALRAVLAADGVAERERDGVSGRW